MTGIRAKDGRCSRRIMVSWSSFAAAVATVSYVPCVRASWFFQVANPTLNPSSGEMNLDLTWTYCRTDSCDTNTLGTPYTRPLVEGEAVTPTSTLQLYNKYPDEMFVNWGPSAVINGSYDHEAFKVVVTDGTKLSFLAQENHADDVVPDVLRVENEEAFWACDVNRPYVHCDGSVERVRQLLPNEKFTYRLEEDHRPCEFAYFISPSVDCYKDEAEDSGYPVHELENHPKKGFRLVVAFGKNPDQSYYSGVTSYHGYSEQCASDPPPEGKCPEQKVEIEDFDGAILAAALAAAAVLMAALAGFFVAMQSTAGSPCESEEHKKKREAQERREQEELERQEYRLNQQRLAAQGSAYVINVQEEEIARQERSEAIKAHEQQVNNDAAEARAATDQKAADDEAAAQARARARAEEARQTKTDAEREDEERRKELERKWDEEDEERTLRRKKERHEHFYGEQTHLNMELTGAAKRSDYFVDRNDPAVQLCVSLAHDGRTFEESDKKLQDKWAAEDSAIAKARARELSINY